GFDSLGNVVFRPDHDFSGTASFTYTIQDSQGATSTAIVTVNVAPVADAPSLHIDPASGAADAAIPLAITVGLTDGSETLGLVTIDGVPTAYRLSHGVLIDEGQWQV